MPSLFDPIRIGAWNLENRFVMAPLTRCRASEGRVPNEMMAEYYRQRSSAGLIISEATSVTPMGVGYPNTPGIWSDTQVDGWRKITRAVHEAAGKILLQLWHVGRISDPVYLNGEIPVAPSAIQPKGHVSLVRPLKEFVKPRALELAELPGVIEAYRTGAANAKAAGFDGVELHGANGYLLDQFLQSSTNHRTDAYGGSLPNRAKLMLEAVDAAVGVWGADHVGLHLAPRGDGHDMGDAHSIETFTYIAKEAGRRGLAFLCAREKQGVGFHGDAMKKAFGGVYIFNEKLTLEEANTAISEGRTDAVAFGQMFIANPDLPARAANDAPLNTPDPSTFYASGPIGYIDYPAMA